MTFADKECNPSLTAIGNSGDGAQPWNGDTFDWQSIIGLFVWLFAVLYSRYSLHVLVRVMVFNTTFNNI